MNSKDIKTKNKLSKIGVTILLCLMITSTFAASPLVVAHDPSWSIPTYAYIQAVPNPIGVGQSSQVYMWIDKIPNGALPTNNVRLHDYKLTITAPDGTITTQTWDTIEDLTSNQGYSFTPVQTGTYTLDFSFPGLNYNDKTGLSSSEYINDTYLPSNATTRLFVQEDPLHAYPTNSLPTEYWARPIYGENSNWWTISSNWLGIGSAHYENGIGGAGFPGDAIGPLTNHIVWTKPFQSGGIVGGNNYEIQGKSFFEGSAYLNRFHNPIIVDGMLFYKEPLSFGGSADGRTVCVDLQTGQEIWSRTDVPSLSFAYMYDVESFNQHGVFPPILFSTTGGYFLKIRPVNLTAYDAYTGDKLFKVTNVPQDKTDIGPKGEYLSIKLNNYGDSTAPNYYLSQWNMSKLWESEYFGASTTPSIVPPITDGLNPTLYDYNVSIPILNTKDSPYLLAAYTGDVALCMSGGTFDGLSYYGTSGPTTDSNEAHSYPYTYYAVNLNSSTGTIGSILWSKTIQPQAGNLTVVFSAADPKTDVFIEYCAETMQYTGYSLLTGEKIWGPVGNQDALAYYWYGYNGEGATVAYGKLYSCSNMAGILYCFDLKTGNQLWSYGNGAEGNNTSSGFEVPGPYPTVICAIGNDVVYTVTSEHTVETPIYKGALIRAINATTGEEIWALSNVNTDGFGGAAIADGYATAANGYDNQIYAIGRSPSKLTVDAPSTAITQGQSIVIRGTVTDIAVGTTQKEQAARFPSGVACVSDASMQKWMEYVYMQQEKPTNTTGIQVNVAVIDANGNYRNIGTSNSDTSGTYSLQWKPDIPGKYTVIATFTGTNAYYGSSAETAFAVDEPTATVTPTAVLTSTADLYLVPGIIGIIVAIIIVGAVIILALRKRP